MKRKADKDNAPEESPFKKSKVAPVSDGLKWIDQVDSNRAEGSIALIRKHGTKDDWMYITFVGQTEKLKYGDSGSGGTDALKKNFADDAICFALVRLTMQVDGPVTTKYVSVVWCGSKVTLIQKTKFAAVFGAAKDFLGITHLSHSCSTQDEVSDEILRAKILALAGPQEKSFTPGGSANLIPKKEVTFSPACKETLESLRGAKATKDWAVFYWKDSADSALSVLASGKGPAEQFHQHLLDDKAAVVFIRRTDGIDLEDASAVKYLLVKWLGPNVPRMQKAQLIAASGKVTEFFLPYHSFLNASDKNEVTEEKVLKELRTVAGTYDYTLPVTPRRRPPPRQPSPPPTPSPTKSIFRPKSLTKDKPKTPVKPPNWPENSALKLVDEPAILKAVNAVQSNEESNNWVLITFTAPKSNSVKLQGTGSGGLEEMKKNFKDDVVMYGVIRVIEDYEGFKVVRFCFIDWHGKEISRFQKANLAPYFGTIMNMFRPYHVDLSGSDLGDFTMEAIMEKLKNPNAHLASPSVPIPHLHK